MKCSVCGCSLSDIEIESGEDVCEWCVSMSKKVQKQRAITRYPIMKEQGDK
jgi:hypothetical protein